MDIWHTNHRFTTRSETPCEEIAALFGIPGVAAQSPVSPDVPAGHHRISWRVIEVDSHATYCDGFILPDGTLVKNEQSHRMTVPKTDAKKKMELQVLYVAAADEDSSSSQSESSSSSSGN